jgi:hypothetical protein
LRYFGVKQKGNHNPQVNHIITTSFKKVHWMKCRLEIMEYISNCFSLSCWQVCLSYVWYPSLQISKCLARMLNIMIWDCKMYWGNMWIKITLRGMNMMTGGEKESNLQVPGENL